MGHGCHDCGVPNGCECVIPAMHCEHANEVPVAACKCSLRCYCRHEGTCRPVISIPRTKTAELAKKRDDALAAECAVLLQKVRELPPPTERERQAQALSFAYGNLALSTNHKPSYNAFLRLAIDRYGWTPGEFQIFAATHEWAK